MKIKCKCEKMLARYENGVLYLWCKSCKKEIGIPIKDIPGFSK